MEKGGTLTITTGFKEENKLVEVKFSDTGCGIAPEILNKIFDPFFTKKEGGTGLGLTITHQIISSHNGKVDVKSKPKEGTTFIITFPVKK